MVDDNAGNRMALGTLLEREYTVDKANAGLAALAKGLLARHQALRDSAVQPHGVAILVYQLDAIDSARAARRTADFVHQFEQHSRIKLRGRA